LSLIVFLTGSHHTRLLTVDCFSNFSPGQYYAGHEFFLDGTNAIFIVVVRLDKTQDSGTKLAFWLRFIKNRMGEKPQSDEAKPTVILVGSSRDAVTDPSVARKQEDGWNSAWGTDQLAKVVSRSIAVAVTYC
jgi:hypothetical protein